MSPDARVRAVLAVARRIADPSDALGREARSELLRTCGLSVEGVELALTEHLERDATEAQMEALCLSASRASRVGERRPPNRVFVVLSGNVCVAAVRAVALALAAAPNVRVKASRRDPTVAEILVRELEPLLHAHRGSIARVSSIDEALPGDAVHAYGSDETLETVGSSLPGGVAYWPHGTGFGLAVVRETDALIAAAVAVARDVVPFDQRGCLSPRIVLVERSAERARDFAGALDASLAGFGERVPRGALPREDERDLRGYVELMRASGAVHLGAQHVVGLDPAPAALWLAPACRAIHVVPIHEGAWQTLVGPLAPKVASLGGSARSATMHALRALCPGARRSPLGSMQRPPLDGPVHLRARPVLT